MNVDDMAEHASDAAGLMKALGNESRLMILCMLADQERSVGFSLAYFALRRLRRTARAQKLQFAFGQDIGRP